MAKFYKMIRYIEGGDFETHETLIDQETFKKYQQAIEMGATHLSLPENVIKISLIKEISPADDIVKEYLDMGVSLKTLGLPEPKKLDTPKENIPNIERLNEMKSKSGFGQMMGGSPAHE